MILVQITLFASSAGDSQSLEELNRFLRSHRILTVDRQFCDGTWHFAVIYSPFPGGEPERNHGNKVDYREVLDAPTFALFSGLRELRKSLAEKENLPPYAVFTNEQLAQIARDRCATTAALEKVQGIGAARVARFGPPILQAIATHEKLSAQPPTNR